MATASAEIQLRERDRLRARVQGDLTAAIRLHAPDYQLVTPLGQTLSRTEYLGAIETGSLRYHQFQPVDDAPIEAVMADDFYAVRYIAQIDVESDGQRSGPIRVWHTDLYRRVGSNWQVIWSQATLITPASDGDNAA